jgi:hypothetical protein
MKGDEDMSEEIKVNDQRIDFDTEEQAPNEAETSEHSKMAADFEAAAAEHDMPELPRLDFPTFVLSLSSSVLVHLGEIPEPESGQTMANLPVAKQTIDILSMLEQKTAGNLDPQEDKLLKDMLFELRMKYVQKVR